MIQTGYLIELDNDKRSVWEKLAKSLAAVMTYAANTERPKVIDPRIWHRQEVQKRSDCQGFSSSSVGEAAYTNATGQVTQFSPHFSYRVSQEIDGIKGDKGSTISGGYEAANRFGLCPLVDCPYPTSYSSAITPAMKAKALSYRIGSFAVCKTYTEVMACLIGGMGVNVGLGWSFSGPSQFVLTSLSGNGPGHATGWLGHSERLDKLGRPYIWCANSGFPIPGWYEISPDAVSKALDHKYTVALAMSRLSHPEPEPILYSPL